MTKISWTEETWNPVTGCSRVSEGCRFCYAETLSLKRGWSDRPWTARNAAHNVILHPERLRKPLGWRQPKRVFVNSMSDCFHPEIPATFIDRIFDVMELCPQHTFQILTKRPERMAEYTRRRYAPGVAPAHIWLGTSVENAKVLQRVDALRAVPAVIHFLSCEPLLGPLSGLNLEDIEWVIVGGEAGLHIKEHAERQMDHAWAREIRDLCAAAAVAFFFKQSSGPVTEMGTSLREADGSQTFIQEYPLLPAPGLWD